MKPLRCLVVALFLVTGAARAQDAEPLKYLTPYLGDDSLVVGWIDVRNVDLKASFERLRKVGADAADIDAAESTCQKVKDRVIDAGVTRVYFTNVGSIMQPEVLFVVPAANPQAIKDVFGNDPALKTRVAGNTLLIGTAQVLDKAGQRPGKASDAWSAALAKTTTLPSQITILPPRALLKAYTELQAELPAELGGGPTAGLVDAIQWASAGLDLSEKLKLDVVVQLKDEAAAKRVDTIVDRGIAIAKKIPEVRESPVLEKLLADNRPAQVGDQIRLTLNSAAIDSAISPLLLRARAEARVTQSINNLKQIGLAMHTFYDANKSLPPQASAGKDKKPLLSWRVQILPYIEENALYKEFHLNEPWDSEHNKTLIPKMPKMYLSPLSRLKLADGRTTYVVPSGPKFVFDGPNKTVFRQITDGTSNTIMTLDVDDSKAVVWTRPEDFPVEQKKPNAGLVRPEVRKILTGFCDGSVRLLSATTPDEVLWLYFCPNDGQVIPQQE